METELGNFSPTGKAGGRTEQRAGGFWAGFPTAQNLPFFNIERKEGTEGVIAAVGWPAVGRHRLPYGRYDTDGASRPDPYSFLSRTGRRSSDAACGVDVLAGQSGGSAESVAALDVRS